MADRDPSQYFWKNRWVVTDNPAAASVATATSPAMNSPNSRPHLETLLYSIWNSNAAQTVQGQVRIHSPAGTVIAAIDNLLAVSAVGQVVATALGIPGKRGRRICATFNTAVASLNSKVTIAGWIDDTDG